MILSNLQQGVPKSHHGNKLMCWSFPSKKQFTSPTAEDAGAKETSDWLSSITSKNLYSFFLCLKHSFHKSMIIALIKQTEKLQLSHMPRYHQAKQHPSRQHFLSKLCSSLFLHPVDVNPFVYLHEVPSLDYRSTACL